MKYIMAFLAMFGCGPEHVNHRTGGVPVDWVVVDRVTVSVSTMSVPSGLFAVSPVNVDISWTEPERGNFDVTCGISVDDTDPDNLALGTCNIDRIRVNKLKVCGPSNDTQCTIAAVRFYTVGAHAGFINTDEGYGVPLSADGNVVGLTDSNATIVESYTIPASRRRVGNSQFPDRSYDLTTDMSNAGVGNYDVDIVIEFVMGI